MPIRPGFRLKRKASPGDLARLSILILIGVSVPLSISYLLFGRSDITAFLLAMNVAAVTIAVIVNLLGSPFNYEGVDDELGIFTGTYLEREAWLRRQE